MDYLAKQQDHIWYCLSWEMGVRFIAFRSQAMIFTCFTGFNIRQQNSCFCCFLEPHHLVFVWASSLIQRCMNYEWRTFWVHPSTDDYKMYDHRNNLGGSDSHTSRLSLISNSNQPDASESLCVGQEGDSLIYYQAKHSTVSTHHSMRQYWGLWKLNWC